MINKNDIIRTRDEYIELIKAELLGPGSGISIPDKEHEVLSDSPNTRYSIGILFPRNNKLNADNDDTARVEEEIVDLDDEEIEEELPKKADKEKTEHDVGPSEEDNLDEEIGMAAQNMPSSMGMTFFVKGNAAKVSCKVSFATYKRTVVSDCRIPFEQEIDSSYELPDRVNAFAYIDRKEKTLRLLTGINRKTLHGLEDWSGWEADPYNIRNQLYKLADQLQKGFVRVPHEKEVVIEFGDLEYVDNIKEIDDTTAKLTALKRKVADDVYAITVMLVNDLNEKAKPETCLYQPKILVDTSGNEFVFIDYSGEQDFSVLSDEEQSLSLQYRNKKVFGTGLGTSVGWKIDEDGNGQLYNDFFPECEVPSMDFKLPEKANVDEQALSMKFLSDLDESRKSTKLDQLRALINAYKTWINEIDDKKNELDEKYHYIAGKNISGCRDACSRMEHGIELLENNTKAWDAFQLANRAMFMQRAHLKLQEMTSNVNRYPGDKELTRILDEIDYYTIDNTIKDGYAWRPFQIAFLLMSVPSIVDDKSSDRDLVDLIWFPTGGGKTEAYLGLTAFTIFYRKLAHLVESDGTTVIMRYTLRLLAAQQFTRASTLICACEYIRCDSIERRPIYKKYPLGKKPITIGLWIGNEHTPNKNETARNNLNKLMKASVQNIEIEKEKYNKFQVLKCPWCGTKLVKDKCENRLVGTFGYRMKNNSHFQLFCPQESCFFNGNGTLPIQVVDVELYENPPTLLFGTVDKFAMLPWNEKIGSFFAVHSMNRSPELIIQDELHLISGPLGTMVGLYEAAIDKMCGQSGNRPKIIASTATIRRAAEQCFSLYNRKVNQFPHPGIDAENSFFARESVINYEKEIYGRKYIGLMPSGKTKAMMEIRSIAALMQRINTMELPYEIKDKFWTLTVYFNSLKDLGKCATLIDDDVKDFIKRMAFRTGTGSEARRIAGADELTSRISTTQLNETLDKLEKLTYSEENLENKRWPSNVLLATNMISVGIDVARLNVMLMVGQPKLTSEYIQASSRVGRSYPGVVFTMYDGSKSRDRSHYEQFKGYHESFYKYVEPTGVTPFSKPARERALHAVIIAMLRQLVPDISLENEAGQFSQDTYSEIINDVTKFILDRNNEIVSAINPDMDTEESIIREEIEYIFSRWEDISSEYEKDEFFYGGKFMVKPPEEGKGRLLKAFNTNRNDKAFDTMTSMRNVDISVGSSILIWEDDES